MHQSTIANGRYYPRIWRGHYSSANIFGYEPIKAEEYGARFHQSHIAATILFGKLFDLLVYIEPAAENIPTYGHKNRELLILACTEIETSFRAILRENSSAYETTKSFGTKDFYKLCTPLRLKEWSVSSRYFQFAGSISPFSSWDVGDPTKSLPWYDAYNAVKHEREKNFHSATFGNVIAAMAALHIVTISQWGPSIYGPFTGEKSPFQIEDMPDFTDEIYVEDKHAGLLPIKYFDQ